MSVDLVEKPSPSTTTPSSQAAALTVKPLTPILGAEVGGIDLRQELDAQTAVRVREALLAHKVLVFRDQPADTMVAPLPAAAPAIHRAAPRHGDSPVIAMSLPPARCASPPRNRARSTYPCRPLHR